jgi:hydroxyacylglutathione hydrolase
LQKEIGPIIFIQGENHGKYPFCHSIFIKDSGILIDPASGRENLQQLKDDYHVQEVWLTHWHEDHFLNIDIFDDLPFCISEPDAPPFNDIETLIDFYGIDDDHRDGWRSFFIEEVGYHPRRPSKFLEGDKTLSLDSVTVEIIKTPGHTPGHLSFFFKEPGILLLGDYDLTKFGPWYGDLDSSIDKTIESVKQLQKIPAEIWLTSHETGFFEEAPDKLWDDYLNVIDTREQKLLDLLKSPRKFNEIANACIIYGKAREPRIFYEFGERSHMRKHLEKLINQGVVVRDSEYYVLL